MTTRRLLFIAANGCANWGGSELLWSLAAEKLVRRGMEIRVSIPDWAKPFKLVRQLQSAGCRIYTRSQPSLANRISRKVFKGPDPIVEHARSLANGVDLVVISQGNNLDGILWMEAMQRTGHRYAVIAEGAYDQLWPDDELAKRLAKAYHDASCAYFVSEANLHLSCRQFGTSLHNARVIRNPFNVSYGARPPWPADATEELLLACVGRLDVGTKGQDLLLQVLDLPHWRQRKVRVSLIGKGVNENVIRLLIKNLELDNVNLVGHVNDIEEVWRSHHALVLPSRCEGMPLVIVEAMLCARPCIATDVGGNRELIRDDVNGFLAKAPSVELLGEALNRAWNARSRLMEMGQSAARDVRRWVGEDPSEDFTRQLEALMAGA